VDHSKFVYEWFSWDFSMKKLWTVFHRVKVWVCRIAKLMSLCWMISAVCAVEGGAEEVVLLFRSFVNVILWCWIRDLYIPKCLFDGDVVVCSRHLVSPEIMSLNGMYCGNGGRILFSSWRIAAADAGISSVGAVPSRTDIPNGLMPLNVSWLLSGGLVKGVPSA
jgi:hypothetical protein